MKTVSLLSILISTVFLTSSTFAAPGKTNYSDQYVPLCVDLARRVVTDKVAHYQSAKKNALMKNRSTASNISFSKFPNVINQKVDQKLIKLILLSLKAKKSAKNFTQKLDAEDKLITNLSSLLKKEAKPFLQNCFNAYKNAEVKCNKFMGANFNKYTQCVSSITGDKSQTLSKFIPYLSYKQKMRSVASNYKK